MTRSVLIVDDNVLVAMEIEAEAQKLGMAVAIARDPGAAIKLAATVAFDAAFVDVHLREPFDGLDLARALAAATEARVVIVTACAAVDLAGRMGGIEDLSMLTKPFEHGALVSLLQSITARATNSAAQTSQGLRPTGAQPPLRSRVAAVVAKSLNRPTLCVCR